MMAPRSSGIKSLPPPERVPLTSGHGATSSGARTLAQATFAIWGVWAALRIRKVTRTGSATPCRSAGSTWSVHTDTEGRRWISVQSTPRSTVTVPYSSARVAMLSLQGIAAKLSSIMLPSVPRPPEHGPVGHQCCNSDWKYSHTTDLEFVCWFCGRRWAWDGWARTWKGKQKADG